MILLLLISSITTTYLSRYLVPCERYELHFKELIWAWHPKNRSEQGYKNTAGLAFAHSYNDFISMHWKQHWWILMSCCFLWGLSHHISSAHHKGEVFCLKAAMWLFNEHSESDIMTRLLSAFHLSCRPSPFYGINIHSCLNVTGRLSFYGMKNSEW